MKPRTAEPVQIVIAEDHWSNGVKIWWLEKESEVKSLALTKRTPAMRLITHATSPMRLARAVRISFFRAFVKVAR